MDITELILSDHHEQRRMFAMLDDVDREDTDTLSTVWERLCVLLEVHAEAEEELFYPQLLDVGTGATDADDADEETEDAISDHNEIRDGIVETNRHDVGSDGWWEGVAQTREANSDHMGEEERQALADFRQHADLETRHRLAVEFAAYEGEHSQGIDSEDKDPSDYIDANS